MKKKYEIPLITVVSFEEMNEDECEIYLKIVIQALSGFKDRKEKRCQKLRANQKKVL